jgi:GNAT superfamily N-acetyltransferase
VSCCSRASHTFVVVASDASADSQILRSYINDVASRYYGRQMTRLRRHSVRIPASTCTSARHAPRCPSPLHGLGCNSTGAPLAAGDVRRLFAAPAARGRGLGAHLMGELQCIAHGQSVSTGRHRTGRDATPTAAQPALIAAGRTAKHPTLGSIFVRSRIRLRNSDGHFAVGLQRLRTAP